MKPIFLATTAVLALAAAIGPATAADVRMYVRASFDRYSDFRKGFDAFEAERQSAGMTGTTVYQNVDKPNEVTVMGDFKSVGAAKAFALSDKLRAQMTKAGVQGPPQIWFAVKK